MYVPFAERILQALKTATPTWVANSNEEWDKAMNRSVVREAFRLVIELQPTGAEILAARPHSPKERTLRLWVVRETTESRWQGEGTSVRIWAQIDEPSQVVGGWGGGTVQRNAKAGVRERLWTGYGEQETPEWVLAQLPK